MQNTSAEESDGGAAILRPLGRLELVHFSLHLAVFRGKIVNVTGQVVEGTTSPPDVQWLRKNILAQALPNGYCALPIVAGPCPHANACLTCAHFRTDRSFLEQHRQQLIETPSIINVAREKNWSRQLEMNERVEQNLQAIITTLEGQTVDA
jgi:hypothetical protein